MRISLGIGHTSRDLTGRLAKCQLKKYMMLMISTVWLARMLAHITTLNISQAAFIAVQASW